MIDPNLLLPFIAAVVGLMLIPGPNVALIVANSMAYGTRFGLLTVAGTASAMVLQLSLAGLGLAKVLGAAGLWFETLRWIGVAYLVAIGIAQWRAVPVDLSKTDAQLRSPRVIYGRALLVSLTNPKTLFFLAAFFPQFMSPMGDAAGQLVLLSLIFLMTALVIDSGWAFAAASARPLLARYGTLRNRLSGGVLIGAGVGLAVVRAK